MRFGVQRSLVTSFSQRSRLRFLQTDCLINKLEVNECLRSVVWTIPREGSDSDSYLNYSASLSVVDVEESVLIMILWRATRLGKC